jgi:hypothetical protein
MNDQILKIIADNPALCEAVRNLILAEFATNEDDLKFDNGKLGERVRARLEGKRAVERAFEKMLSYKTIPSRTEKIMRAR